MSPQASSQSSLSLQKLSQGALVFLAFIAGAAALNVAKNVLLPLVFALFLYVLILPLINFLTNRWKLPRVASLLIAFLIYSFVAFLGISFSVSSIRSFALEWETYQHRFVEAGEELQLIAARLGFDFLQTDWLEMISGSKLLDLGRLVTGSLLDWVSLWGLVSIYLIFLFAGQTQKQKAPQFVKYVQSSLLKYIVVKGVVALATALLVGLVLWIVGAELVFLFALLAFVLNFIPSLGSIIATALPLPVLWLQFGFGGEFILALALMVSIQVTLGNVIEPRFMGKSLNMHPVTVMFFLVFWGFLWGISGAFLSVPLTVILHASLSHIQTTKPLAELMSGKLSSTE